MTKITFLSTISYEEARNNLIKAENNLNTARNNLNTARNNLNTARSAQTTATNNYRDYRSRNNPNNRIVALLTRAKSMQIMQL